MKVPSAKKKRKTKLFKSERELQRIETSSNPKLKPGKVRNWKIGMPEFLSFGKEGFNSSKDKPAMLAINRTVNRLCILNELQRSALY